MASSKARSRNRPAPGKGNRAKATPVVTATPTSPAKPAPASGTADGPGGGPGGSPAGGGPTAARGSQVRVARQARQPAEVVPEPARPTAPLWLQLVSLVLAVLGLAVSAYETYAHFNGSHLAGCPSGGGGAFNCTAVITSAQSMVFGVFPVAILGLAFYVFVVAIMTPWAWRTQRREVHLLRLVSMVVGMGFVMYLIYAEVYQIQQVCEYCTGVHIITFLLFCLTLVAAALWGTGSPKTARP